jgi:hypothetical protein
MQHISWKCHIPARKDLLLKGTPTGLGTWDEAKGRAARLGERLVGHSYRFASERERNACVTPP